MLAALEFSNHLEEWRVNNGVKVLLVDDHPLVREGLKALLQDETDLKVCAEAGSVRQALLLARQESPDIAILDLFLEDGNGLELIRRLRHHYPEMRMLVCSISDETLFAERVLDAGAQGYVNKAEITDQIVEAIRRVQAGQIYFSPGVMQGLIQGLHRKQGPHQHTLQSLSNRELEVFSLIGQGHSTSEVACQLNLSVKTIETHRDKIKRKLGLPTSQALFRRAVQWDMEQH